MFGFILGFHNIMRWVVVILAVVSLTKAYLGWIGKRPYTKQDRMLGVFFTSSMDIQLLLGGLLYFVYSEFALKAIINQGMAFVMENSVYRFFATEHIFYMLAAIVIAHIGSARVKKVEDQIKKHQLTAVFFTLAVLLVLIGIPWSRPLFPGA